MCLELHCRAAMALSHRQGSGAESKKAKSKKFLHESETFALTETLPISAHICKPRE